MLKKKDFRNTDALTAFVNANNVDVVTICYTPAAMVLFYREEKKEAKMDAKSMLLNYIKGGAK